MSLTLRDAFDVKRLKERLRPAQDPEGEAGRAHERERRIILSALASAAAKAISLFSILLTVPLTLGYLGPERYGIWTTIASLMAVLSFADLGLGFGLVNALSKAEGAKDGEVGQQAVSSAFFLLAGVALGLALLLVLTWGVLPWAWLFNSHSDLAGAEVGPAMAVFLGIFLLGLPLSIAIHGHAGLQQSYRNSFYQIPGSLLTLLALLLAVRLQAGLPWLVLAGSGVGLLVQLFSAWSLYGRQRPDLRPRWSKTSPGVAGSLLGTGSLFFLIQVAGTVAYQVDALVLTRILGPESVATYSVVQKLFQQVPLILGFVLTPLWPAYSEARARGDMRWVRSTFRRSLKLAFIVNVPAALILFAAAPVLLNAWVGPVLEAPKLLLISLSVWAACNTLNGPLAMLLNGLGALRFLAISSVLMAGANLLLSIVLTRALGMAGVVLGSLGAQVLFLYLPCAYYVPKLLAMLSKEGERP